MAAVSFSLSHWDRFFFEVFCPLKRPHIFRVISAYSSSPPTAYSPPLAKVAWVRSRQARNGCTIPAASYPRARISASLPSCICPNTSPAISCSFVVTAVLTVTLPVSPIFSCPKRWVRSSLHHFAPTVPRRVPAAKSPTRPSSRASSAGSNAGCNSWATRTTSDTFSPVGGLLRSGRPQPTSSKGIDGPETNAKFLNPWSIILLQR